MTAKEARKQFLKRAKKIIKRQFEYSETFQRIPEAQKQQFDCLVKMMIAESDSLKFKISSTNSILNLLEKGKISVKESKELMSILKDKVEIEEIPKLMKQLEALSKKQR
jgi:DNA-binding ferritin-like protein (Dps family)